ncbi:MAG: ribonuclease HII [Bacteroidales bacterium]
MAERKIVTRAPLLQFYKAHSIEAGCDEAGRGPLAGPLYAAAVILPPNFSLPMLNDSKKLSEKSRNILRKIIEREALSWGVGVVSVEEITEINILNGAILAMHRALEKLNIEPEHIIVDGPHFKQYRSTPHSAIVDGDSKYASIAAASILAKTHRDQYMVELAEQYPGYGWEKNKGYPTKEHREAIARLGVAPHHRTSFKLGL